MARYVQDRMRRLALIEAMWRDPFVQLYNDPELPLKKDQARTVFLAGPTSRHQILEYNWRSEAVALLRAAGFTGYIYVPEPRGEEAEGDFTEKSYVHHWESTRLLGASHPAFWVPREGTEMLGLNTNFEWGFKTAEFIYLQQQMKKPRLFVGWPDDAERMGLPNHYCTEHASIERRSTLESLCQAIAAAM